MQREEKPACGEEGLRRSSRQPSRRSFTSSLSQNDLWDPSFRRGRVCKTGKTKIARSWTTADLCQGRELDCSPASLGLEGKGEKLTRKFPRGGCSEAPQSGPQNAYVCKSKDWTLKFLSGGSGGGGGGSVYKHWVCLESQKRLWNDVETMKDYVDFSYSIKCILLYNMVTSILRPENEMWWFEWEWSPSAHMIE